MSDPGYGEKAPLCAIVCRKSGYEGIMEKPCGVILVGGSGYGAGELARLLAAHPAIDLCGIVSRSHAGESVSTIHSHLTGVVSLTFDSAVDLSKLRDKQHRAVILAMPPGQASLTIQSLISLGLDQHTTVLDLSGDFRLRSETQHQEYYPEVPFDNELRQRFTYGLPELQRTAIAAARFITNPGCLATGAILALAPLTELLASGSASGSEPCTVVIDGKTGTSGAGREPQASMHHPSRCADFTAYRPLMHRHEPEIVQALGEKFQENFQVMFVPHLLPISRGIFVTAYISHKKSIPSVEIEGSYRDFYRSSPFIRLRSAPPRLVDVVGTNFCDIFVTTRGSQIVVMTATDNLGKGMAGQAIQNLNLTSGLAENTGLLSPALGPV